MEKTCRWGPMALLIMWLPPVSTLEELFESIVSRANAPMTGVRALTLASRTNPKFLTFSQLLLKFLG